MTCPKCVEKCTCTVSERLKVEVERLLTLAEEGTELLKSYPGPWTTLEGFAWDDAVDSFLRRCSK